MNEIAKKRSELSRKRLLDTAREVLANEGLDCFVLREIAKRAEMQLGNLQYYFPTRDDLLEAVIREEFEHNLSAMRALEDSAKSLRDYTEQLTELLINEYTGIGGNIWPVLTLLHLHSRRFRRLSEEIYQQHFDIVIDALRRFGVHGNTGKLREKARLLTAIIDGATLQAHAGPHSRDSRAWKSLCRETARIALTIAEA